MGLFKTAAKVAVASSVHGRVQRRQQSKWAQQDAAASAPAPVAAPAPAPQPVAPPEPAPAASEAPAFTDTLEMLTKLGELKAAGVLTDAEFEAQKARLLAG